MADGNLNQKRFDAISKDWDRKPRRVVLAENVFEAMHASGLFSTSSDVLEFGCGTGLLTMQIAPDVHSIEAWDVASNMLDQLRDKIRTHRISNINVRHRDIVQDTVGPQYDLICCSMTLHHIADTASLFVKLRHHLKPAGRLAIADLDDEDGFFHSHVDGVAHFGFNRNTLETQLKSAGFRNITFKTVHKIEKLTKEGVQKSYPVFLLCAEV
jgi:2-polyprenyl-3-methyl-5-hydroxy-6-metoxy-1,4-benzoquinol methylase